MNRTLVAFGMLFLSAQFGWGQSNTLAGHFYGSLTLYLDFVNTLILRIDHPAGNEKQPTENATYKTELDHKVPYIVVTRHDGSTQKWLALWSNSAGGMFLYTSSGSAPKSLWGKRDAYFLNPNAIPIKASAQLTEDGRVYSVDDLMNTVDGHPWATKGSAVGQSITIGVAEPSGNARRMIQYVSSLIFSLGYVSYAKPYLYTANSRPREVEISDLDKRYTVDVTLKDTPNLQEIRLPYPTSGVKMRILSVYRGDRWSDTCINLLIPVASILGAP